MVKLTITPYEAAAPLINAAHRDRTKLQGWYVRLEQGEVFGLGEAYVWPGFGSTNAQTKLEFTRFNAVLPQLDSASAMLKWLDEQEAIVSPVKYAMELACFDLIGKQSRKTVAALLWKTPANRIPCHTTLKSWAEHDDLTQWSGLALKLKMGLLDPDVEHARINSMLSAQPNIRVRLDANGAWSLSHAQRMCALTERYPNVVIEQPLASEQFEALHQLQRNTATVIALDESFALNPSASLDTECREIVVKPMYAGGLMSAKKHCEQIAKAHKGICITHALEGPIGRAGAQHFAAGIHTDGAHGVGDETSVDHVTIMQTDGHGVV